MFALDQEWFPISVGRYGHVLRTGMFTVDGYKS